MRSTTSYLLPLALAIGGCAFAVHRGDPIDALTPGAVVRVTRACAPTRQDRPCPRHKGELVSIDRDTVRIRLSADSTVQALGAAEVTLLERCRGHQNLILGGAVLGMVTGALVVGVASAECADNETSLPCMPVSGSGALAGALAGAAVGAFLHPEQWSRVAWPPPQAPSPGPQEPTTTVAALH